MMSTATLPKGHKAGPKERRYNILIKPAHTINNNAYLPMPTQLSRKASAGDSLMTSAVFTQQPRACNNLRSNGKVERKP